MSDEAAFLAAIVASPGDDLPRLVFADWLDERGDGERAEFVRLACQRMAAERRLAELRPEVPAGWARVVDPPTPPVVPPRLRSYLHILGRGLVLLRNFAHTSNVELSRIEADHLHNIPRLLFEEHEYSHEYYIRGERGLYLQRLRELGAVDYLEQAGIWYSEPWMTLAEAAGVRLLAWDQEAEPAAAPPPASE